MEHYKTFIYSSVIMENECLIWQKVIGSHGYGLLSVNGKLRTVHRLIYEIEIGKIPKGKIIRHLCNNRLCINIYHLQVGTHLENSYDTLLDKNNNFAKLNIDQVKEIKQLLKEDSNVDIELLATKYNIPVRCIKRIRNGETWKFVD